MKLRFSFKDPDVMYDEVNAATVRGYNDLVAQGMPQDEAQALTQARHEKLLKACHRWFEYGEYCVVEIDTVADTATVVRPS